MKTQHLCRVCEEPERNAEVIINGIYCNKNKYDFDVLMPHAAEHMKEKKFHTGIDGDYKKVRSRDTGYEFVLKDGND